MTSIALAAPVLWLNVALIVGPEMLSAAPIFNVPPETAIAFVILPLESFSVSEPPSIFAMPFDKLIN